MIRSPESARVQIGAAAGSALFCFAHIRKKTIPQSEIGHCEIQLSHYGLKQASTN
jgi:hypothetical protein